MTILFAILTACAFSLPYKLLDPAEIGVLMPERTVLEELTAFLPVLGKRMYPQCLLLFLLSFFLYRVLLIKISKKQFSMSACVTALLFTFYLIAGEYGAAYRDLSVLFKTFPQTVVTVLQCFGFFSLFYVVVRAAFVFFDERRSFPVTGHLSEFIF